MDHVLRYLAQRIVQQILKSLRTTQIDKILLPDIHTFNKSKYPLQRFVAIQLQLIDKSLSEICFLYNLTKMTTLL